MSNEKFRTEFRSEQSMLNPETFDLYYYSDRSFRTVNPHVHDFYEYYFPVSQNITMEIAGIKYALNNCSVVIVPPGINHRAISDAHNSVYQRYVLWISEPFMKDLKSRSADFDVLNRMAVNGNNILAYSEDEIATIHTMILRILQEIRYDRFGRDTFLSIELEDLIMTMARKNMEHNTKVMPNPIHDDADLIQSITHYIDRHLNEELTIKQLAKRFYVSEYYISHLFSDHLHITPHQYILKMRLAHARLRIMQGASISRVYQDCGFTDYSTFYRAFMKEYTMSPRQLQKYYQNDLRTEKK